MNSLNELREKLVQSLQIDIFKTISTDNIQYLDPNLFRKLTSDLLQLLEDDRKIPFAKEDENHRRTSLFHSIECNLVISLLK